MTTSTFTKSCLAILAFVLLWSAGESIALGCPNCRDGLASDPAQAGLVRGLFYSIIFLLSMPFLITAGLGGYFYLLIHRARKVAPVEAAQSGSPFLKCDSEVAEELESAGV